MKRNTLLAILAITGTINAGALTLPIMDKSGSYYTVDDDWHYHPPVDMPKVTVDMPDYTEVDMPDLTVDMPKNYTQDTSEKIRNLLNKKEHAYKCIQYALGRFSCIKGKVECRKVISLLEKSYGKNFRYDSTHLKDIIRFINIKIS
jgi:hypothetical protein